MIIRMIPVRKVCRKKVLKVCSGIFLLTFFGYYVGRESCQRIQIKTTTAIKHVKQEADVDTQQERLRRLHDICDKHGNFTHLPGYRKWQGPFFVSYKYKWSMCKMGKMASTQFTQFFYILHHGRREVGRVMTLERHEVHTVEDRENVILGYDSSFDKTRLILTARNPYTRLFSAFIDKMFAPSTSGSVRVGGDFKCKTAITFAEFLLNIIKNTKRGKFDYHWTAMTYYCRPCEFKPFFIFKLETFKYDFEYILNNTKLEPYKKEIVELVLKEDEKWTGFGLIDDVMNRIAPGNQGRILACMNWELIVHRVWETLIIQGFISVKALFPSHLYRKPGDFKNHTILTEAVRHTRAKYPLSKAEKAKQRLDAMNRFYSTVEPSIIQGIQEIYRPDFELFGYSIDPPPW